MILSPKQSILFVAILSNLIASMAFTKPPINADFVNGLWARIGKRARDNERVGLNYEIKCNEPSKMDLKTYLANCIDTTEKDDSPSSFSSSSSSSSSTSNLEKSLLPNDWNIRDSNSNERYTIKLRDLLMRLAEHMLAHGQLGQQNLNGQASNIPTSPSSFYSPYEQQKSNNNNQFN